MKSLEEKLPEAVFPDDEASAVSLMMRSPNEGFLSASRFLMQSGSLPVSVRNSSLNCLLA